MNVSEGGDLRGAGTSSSCEVQHSQVLWAQASPHCAQSSRRKQGPVYDLLFATEAVIWK